MSDKLFVKIKLSRWRAKIVTSLLPQPSVLAFRANFKTVTTQGNCHDNRNLSRSLVLDERQDLSWYFYFVNSIVIGKMYMMTCRIVSQGRREGLL